MGGTVPERDESLARQLGCCIPNLQVFQRRQDGILHDKCNRIAQFLLPSPKPPEERVSEFAGIIKSPVSGKDLIQRRNGTGYKKAILTVPGAEIADAVMGCGSTTGRNVDKAEKLGIELDEIERMPE